ncbi:hypothetical protein MNBD_ACTINO01-1920 [hydrothermal vent metagenome]|uniref:Uncharacterized protein n=1 Tax=hydrothermal vent metagenome TaxID=652676 RepID=A0A3B0SV32_9ZZZZ
MFVLRIVGSDLPLSVSLPGAVGFGAVVVVPSVLAFLAGRGRAGLYLGAGVASIVLSLGLSLLIVVMLPLGVFWLWSYVAVSPGHLLRAVGAGLVATMLVLGAFVVLFLHIDPRCADTYANGEVRLVPQEQMDMESGWAWDIGGTSSSSMMSRPDVVSQVCSSDVVTWPEALVSLALAGAAVASARAIAAPGSDDREIARKAESPSS